MTGAGAVYTPAHATRADAEVPDELREVKSVDAEMTRARQGAEGLAAGETRGLASARAVPAGGFAYRFAKRAFDIAFSACAVAVGLIPGAILCAVIMIDSPGCPIYGQKRMGKMGPDGRPREFTMWKFRSMVRDADSRLAELLDRNEIKGPMFKMADDPRVTRVGRFIRRHSVDELPQFLNVLLGQMSVVGPRPPLPREVAQYDERAMRRLAVKPGLTGPWQVGGRSDLDFDEMVELDLEYIANRSAALDLKLVAKTVVVMLTGEGAH